MTSKQHFNYRHNDTVPCPVCRHFDETRFREYPNSKGYCTEMNRILYSFPDICLDFEAVIPKIELEVKQGD